MRNAKLWSVLLAAVLLCACVVGVMFTSASADGAEIYGVNYTEGVDAAKQFTSIEEVFADVEAIVAAGNWPAGKSLEIRFTGTLTAKKGTSELLFGQKTVFTATDKKLPITIKGMEADNASVIEIDAERIACANDYTFETLTLDTWTSGTEFFAGSGKVTFKNLAPVAQTEAALGCLYADNYTAEAYAGWTKANMQAQMDEDQTVLTSLTFDGYEYKFKGGNSTPTNVAAVGGSNDTDNYSAAASDDSSFVITPASTKAKIHWVSGTATDLRIGGYRQAEPARVHTAIIYMEGGKLAMLCGDDGASNVTQNIVNANLDVHAENAVLGGTPIRLLFGTATNMVNDASQAPDPASFDNTKYGNVTLYAKNITGGSDYYLSGSGNVYIDGKFTATIDNCKKTSTAGINYIGIFGKQGVETNLSNLIGLINFNVTRITVAEQEANCEFKTTLKNVVHTGTQFNLTGYSSHDEANKETSTFYVKKITNKFEGCTFNGANVYAAGSATDVDEISTTIDSCTFGKNFYGSSDSAAAKPVFGTIVNTVKDTVEGKATSIPTAYYGAYSCTADSITNNVYSGTIGSYELVNNKFSDGDRTFYYGAHSVTVTGDLTTTIYGGTIYAYRGAYSVSAKNVVNNVEGGTVGFAKTSGDYAHFYGAVGGTAGAVKNSFKGGTVYSVHGLNGSGATADLVRNEICGGTIGYNFVGVYYVKDVGAIEFEMTSGKIGGTYYAAYGRTTVLTAGIDNTISGGTVGGSAYLGGYGGSFAYVKNKISGDVQFTSETGSLHGAGGNSNWTSLYRGDVETTVEGGTFNCYYFGGAGGGTIVGNVKNTITGGTFNNTFYGGSYANAYYQTRSNNSAVEAFTAPIAGKGIQGKIINVIGTQGDAENAPVFNKAFFGGNSGTTAAANRINEGDCVVENTVYNATFNGNYFGANNKNAYRTLYTEAVSPEIEMNVTNEIYGGTFTKVFFGTCEEGSFVAEENETVATVVGGLVKNHIRGGIFADSFFGAFAKKCAPGTLDIENHFFGGEFRATYNYLGNGTDSSMIGTVTNTFEDGFVTTKGYVYCGGMASVTAPAGKYATVNVVNGGVFHGFWGANGAGIFTGDAKTTVYGGTFDIYKENMRNSIAGGTRNGVMIGNTELDVYGGTFIGDVVGGTIYGSYDACSKEITGNITVNVYGGELYGGVYGICQTEGEITCTGTATVTFDADDVIKIGKNTNIKADQVTGKLTVLQTEGWLAHDYLKLPANSQCEIIESPEIFGSYTADDTILVKGDAISAKGATLRLGERLGVRILLNKADVDAYGEAFTYTVKLGDTKIAEGGYAEIVENNYSILFDGIGLSQFGETFTVDSSTMADIEYSIAELAAIAKDNWTNPEWKAYAEALLEFHNVYNLDAQNTKTPDAVAFIPVATRGNAGAQTAKATLLMSDAAGLRLTVTLEAAPVNAKFVVGSKEVAATVDGNTISAELFFAHEYLAESFTVSVQSDAGEHMTYTASIEALAAQLMNQQGNENADNAQAFLYYAQKAVACK